MEIVRPTYSQSLDVPSQLVYSLPKRLGNGSVIIERFTSGLRLMNMTFSSKQPITFIGETTDWSFGVAFHISGNSQVYMSGHRKPLLVKPGLSGHYIYPKSATIKTDAQMGSRLVFAILFDKKTLLDLAGDDEESFLPFLKGIQTQDCYRIQELITPEMKKKLGSIVACPFNGKTRALYIEGTVMELLALKLEQIKAMGKSIPQQPRVSVSDIERIHYAAELLVRDPVNPPDLTELAGQIGMSRSKFYHLFKKVLEHSPVVYLRSHRLQFAKQLLRQGDHNVTEVAFAVGFNNLSYFARVFNAEFGVHPRQVKGV